MPIPRLYALADARALAPRALADAVEEMVENGVRWIQIRAKYLDDAALYRQVERCCRVSKGSGTRLWINDRVDLARLLEVGGLHLGQDDMSPAEARRILGAEVPIGLSTHSLGQVEAADRDPDVSLVAFGPVFPTTSRENPSPVVGLEALRRARQVTHKPLVAIGGVDAGNAREVLEAGADSVALIGGVCRGSVADNCRRLLRVLEASPCR